MRKKLLVAIVVDESMRDTTGRSSQSAGLSASDVPIHRTDSQVSLSLPRRLPVAEVATLGRMAARRHCTSVSLTPTSGRVGERRVLRRYYFG